MLKAVPMVHFRVQVPNRDAGRVARCVAEEGLLHLVDVAHGRCPTEAPEGTAGLLESFEALAGRVRDLATHLGLTLPPIEGALSCAGAEDLLTEHHRLAAQIEPAHHDVVLAARALAEAEQASAQARTAAGHLARLDSAELDPDHVRALRFTVLRLGLADPEALAALPGLLAPVPVAALPLEEGRGPGLMAVVTPVSGQDRLDEALRVLPFESVSLPAGGAEAVSARRRSAEAAQVSAADRLAGLRAELAPRVPDWARRVEVATLLLRALLRFAEAGRFTVLSGWVPEESAERLRQAIARVTSGRAVVDVVRPEHLPEVASGALGVPILHRNPLFLRPFQRLIRLYGTPSYGEMEPTPFFAFSLLLMFGLMFGDVGHGAVLFAVGWLLFRRVPRFLDYGVLLMEAGVASTLFGFLYGSLFGIEGLLPVLWMEPLRDLDRFMPVALAFGAVLVSLGLVLGILNAWRSGEKAAALFGTHGLFGATLYWIALVLVARALVPGAYALPPWAIVAMAAVPAALLLLRPVLVRRLEGARRPPRPRGSPGLVLLEAGVEVVDTLFAFFANTVSFVRIAAFAAVHAGIFVALFAVADSLAPLAFGGPLSILALVLGNVLVILLEGLTVTVQVLRLEYYEFFSKFFRGGGEDYAPLRLRPPPVSGGEDEEDGRLSGRPPGEASPTAPALPSGAAPRSHRSPPGTGPIEHGGRP